LRYFQPRGYPRKNQFWDILGITPTASLVNDKSNPCHVEPF
jgi:hypothetical protein